ncbi:hypothetical protein A5906_26515 [Bradyrhizobium sacchari]|uniref:Trypsin n=1 Tax=Bradyrhizobium sacchari TaxID=1399419 RepID=A0A560JYJ9_9BRAD|nr:S1 family peptidase [Bradyrhizobium sacchari]OPY99277.1 hypothetical protein A5906_26515 [Bradyrhizobium sacchari]TWB62905.1 trypsin [Bradyrhizobium sacchari]TWB76165.1 trypsin [Bradyrhizobium sacchari]
MAKTRLLVPIIVNLGLVFAAAAQELKPQIGEPMPPFRNAAASTEAFSSIVGGTVTKDFPGVGALVQIGPTNQVVNACTGTLVGCRWFLTAGHCVAQQNAETFKIFFHSAGFFDVKNPPLLAPEYKPCANDEVTACPRADVALLELVHPIVGIKPLPITRNNPVPPGDTGTIVGFGTTSSSRADFGIKRRGAVTAGTCKGSVVGADDQGWLCWKFLSGKNATNCSADSGGPYVASNGAAAGVTSGDLSKVACTSGALVFDTRLTNHSSWFNKTASDIKSAACGEGPQAGEPSAPSTQLVIDNYKPDGAPYSHTFTVDEGVSSLNVSAAGTGAHFYNVHMSLSLGSPTKQDQPDQRCKPDIVGNLAYCAVESPEPGQWQIVVSFNTSDPSAEMPFIYQIVASEYFARK